MKFEDYGEDHVDSVDPVLVYGLTPVYQGTCILYSGIQGLGQAHSCCCCSHELGMGFFFPASLQQ